MIIAIFTEACSCLHQALILLSRRRTAEPRAAMERPPAWVSTKEVTQKATLVPKHLVVVVSECAFKCVCMSTIRTYATTVTETNLHGLTTCVMSPYPRLQADKAACHHLLPPSAAGPPPDDYRHGTGPRAAPDRGVCTVETCLCVATGKSHPLKTNWS